MLRQNYISYFAKKAVQNDALHPIPVKEEDYYFIRNFIEENESEFIGEIEEDLDVLTDLLIDAEYFKGRN